MIQSFSINIQKEKLFFPSARILLAVSGGVDSIVLFDLFKKAGFQFGIAHCNFFLRGIESNEDEKFVKRLANKYKVPFYCKKFDIKKIVDNNKASIQMAAREMRYQWFEEVRREEKYCFIATAHHQDDSIETFFINLVRGTGIAGLHGILPKQGNLIRPLLFATKNQIVEYAEQENLFFREDSSNVSDKYMRNKIRHHIIPVLKELNPNIQTTFSSTIQRLIDVEEIYKKEIEKARKKVVIMKREVITISIKELKKFIPTSSYLFEFLKPYHFNSNSIDIINQRIGKGRGKIFYSSTHRMTTGDDFLFIEPRATIHKLEDNILIQENQREANFGENKLMIKTLSPQKGISMDSKTASLDLDKLSFPLEVRKWKKGDSFYPLNMIGKKKLSDFFIDKKLSVKQKEDVWLLTSGGKIVWIIGLRIDNRFKFTKQTKKIFFAKLVK